MRRGSWIESNWAALFFILAAQIVLPIVALATCHARSSEGPDTEREYIEHGDAFDHSLHLGESH